MWPLISARLGRWLTYSERTIVFPQDDYTACGLVEKFVLKHRVDAVYSAVNRDLAQLYPSLVGRVRIEQCYTGYVEPRVASPLSLDLADFQRRPIDLGNRVRRLPLYFGLDSIRKAEVTEVVARHASSAGLSVDVSSLPQDTLIGTDWTCFLRRTRFTTGSRGGGGIADPFGRLSQRYWRRLRRNGGDDWDAYRYAVRTHHRVGDFSAVGPRIFESTEAGVCQILERGDYFPDFEPWVHYVPLEADLSNVDQVVRVIEHPERGHEIASAAHARLILTGEFTYQTFVKRVLDSELGSCTGNSSRRFIGVDAIDQLVALGSDVVNSALAAVRQSLLRGRCSTLIADPGATLSDHTSNRESLELLRDATGGVDAVRRLASAALSGELTPFGLSAACVTGAQYFPHSPDPIEGAL